MSRLAARSELMKLARSFEAAPEQLAFLATLPSEALRHLRLALLDRYHDERRRLFQRLARVERWLPLWLTVLIARWWLGPQLTARLAGVMPAEHAALITRRLAPEFMAEVAAWLDPRRARELILLVPVDRIVAVAMAMLARRDYVTLGRFVEYVSDEAVRAVGERVEDEGELLEIVFHVDSKNRLDHLVRVLPQERVRKAILIVQDTSRRELWPKILALVTNVGYELKRELGDLAASQGESVLESIVNVAQEEELWEDLLPVVACLSEATQRQVVNLPVLREPAVMQRIIGATDAEGLWTAMLSLAQWMEEPARASVARVIEELPRAVVERIAYAALLREQWEVALDIVARLTPARQRECLEIVEGYREAADTE
ncbi:MAG TPA: hypothetical protein VLI06_11945, partial [Solimonas sp.]|nr:hypothetical protein [Solimonas sp.]